MHQSLRFIACRSNIAQHVSGKSLVHHQELINCRSRRCTEFHRVKNANLRHPSAVC